MAVATGTALAIGMGGLGLASGVMQGSMEKDSLKYQAKVAKADAKAESLAIGAQAEQLADDQREMRSMQRVTAAQSGGGLSSGQNIMILAEQARKMQMDQLELQRQQDLTLMKGRQTSSLLKQQGKNAMIGGVLKGISGGIGAFSGAGGFGGGAK